MKEITLFEATDGRQFISEAHCREYELKLEVADHLYNHLDLDWSDCHGIEAMDIVQALADKYGTDWMA